MVNKWNRRLRLIANNQREINGLCAKMVAEVIYLCFFPSILQMASGGFDFALYFCVCRY